MTADELDQAGRELGIRLPAEYRRLMRERHDEMASKTIVTWAGRVSFFHDCLYQVADKLISNNLAERRPGRGLAESFPGWERTYLLIGDNAGDHFLAMRLDESPGVFTLDTDDDGNPEPDWPNLGAYIDQKIEDHAQSLRNDLFWDRKNPPTGLSSFRGDCPPADRLGIWLTAGLGRNDCQLTYQGDDRNLTPDLLGEAGVDLAGIEREVARLFALLLADASGRIFAKARVTAGSPAVPMVVVGTPLAHPEHGYRSAALFVAGTAMDITFEEWAGDSPAEEWTFDWDALREAIDSLFRAGCPGIGAVRVRPIGEPKRREQRVIFPFELCFES